MRAGFTLIEMLVVLAIIVIITTIVITSQGSFNRTLILTNTTYDVALTLRSAESYGVGSRAAGGMVNAGYGLDFNRGTPTVFTLFADAYPTPSSSSVCHPTSDPGAPDAKPGNCSYESGSGETVTSYTLGRGISVNDFCAFSAGSWSCANSHGSSLSTLDIVFSRPSPQPFMSVNGSYSPVFPVTASCLALTSPQGGARFISVSATGEISATATSCP